MLLALWDGDEKDISPGGAAEVVTFKRDGIPLELTGSARESLDSSEIGPVIEIVTPREKNPQSPRKVAVKPWGKAIVGRKRRDADVPQAERRASESWKKFATLVQLTQEFNRDAGLLLGRADATARVGSSLDSLFSDSEGGTSGNSDAKEHAAEVAPLWCRFHTIADALSQERQKQFRTDWKLMFALGLVTFLWFAAFANFGPTQPLPIAGLLLAGYSLSLVAVLTLFARAVLHP